MREPGSTRRPATKGGGGPAKGADSRPSIEPALPAPAPSNRRIGRPKPPSDLLAALEDTSGLADAAVQDDAARLPPPAPAPPRAPSRLGAMLRAVVGGALVVAVSGGVAWAARRHIVGSPRFAVTEIVVSGAKHRAAEELETEGGLARGQNVFTVDLDRVRAKLLGDPWIAEATLARRLPGTILVQVTEREAGAIVALSDSYLASRDGEIFKRLEIGDPTDLPIVTGITNDQVAEDRDGVAQMVRRAQDLANDYEHGPLAERAPLEEVHLGRDGSVSLVVGKDGIGIALGDPPFRRKLDQAARVLAELDRRGAKAETIMIDNLARPERVVVRMR
jgi:cell division protein FtsQ